jgi:dihydroorotase
MPLLAHVFEEENALDKLAGFASENGPAFYRLPVNSESLTLEKQATPVAFPQKIETQDGPVTVFDPGFDVFWKVA